MRVYEFITETTYKKLFHVSKTKNRNSILQYGLTSRNQEFINIEREPKIHFMQTKEQARDWAFWFALDEHEEVDIWEVTLPDGYNIVNDPHPEMDIYNAFIGTDVIKPDNLKVVFKQQIPTSSEEAPPFSKKMK